MIPDLVYDVGMNDGQDTAYYLARGYRVVAVEADPTLIESARTRFADAVKAGRLTLVQAAVGAERSTAKFWISTHNRVWNSFIREVAARNGAEHYSIDVDVRPFADIMREHGVPMYLKIDIEGHDHYCLEAMSPTDPPKYVSWEVGEVSEIAAVAQKGYNAFQCISQNTLMPLQLGSARGSQQMPARHRVRKHVQSVITKVPGAVPLARKAKRLLRNTPASIGEPGKPPIIRRFEWPGGTWQFPFGSSGPFGEDLAGPWKTAEEITYGTAEQPRRRAA